MAWRNEPAPESAVVVTSNVAAIAVTAEKTTTTAMLRRNRVSRKVDFHCAVPCLDRWTGRGCDDGFIALMLNCASLPSLAVAPIRQGVRCFFRKRLTELGMQPVFQELIPT